MVIFKRNKTITENQCIKDYIMVIFERENTLNQYIKDYIIIFIRNKQKQINTNCVYTFRMFGKFSNFQILRYENNIFNDDSMICLIFVEVFW